MFKKWSRHPIFWFYLLAIYVILQFIWWGILLVQLTADKYEGYEDISRRLWMVAGEGIVFLLILLIGIWQVRKSFMKEMKLSRQQNNFLLSVSHELKTPLSSIKLYLQTLKNRELNKEKTEEVLSFSLEETERLHNMIDNILTASKLEYHNFEIYPESFNLSEFLENKIQQLTIGLGRNHRTVTNIQKDIVSHADKSAFGSIINNLYENAVKYSEVNTEISVNLIEKNGLISLKVCDQGIGIGKEEQKNLFQKFYRVGNEEVRNTKGTGLGLYIVDQYVKLMQGEIKIQSPVENDKGTCITVEWKK